MMYLIDYRDVVTQNHELWVKRFEKRYTRPGEESKRRGSRPYSRSPMALRASAGSVK